MTYKDDPELRKNIASSNALNYEQRLNHPRRCTARRQRDGEPCGRFAIRGGTVCRLHGGATKHAQRKAKERLGFAKAIMLERAVRGLTPDPRMSPADKRLAKAVAKQQGKPGPRRATRPAGPPASTPAPAARQEVPESQPGLAAGGLPAQEPPRRTVPAFAEPSDPPKRGLTTAEDALADVARANRRAGALSHRRKKRR